MTTLTLPPAGDPLGHRIVSSGVTGRQPQYMIMPRTSMFQVTLHVELLDEFYYWTGPKHDMCQMFIPAGRYDGFSIPWMARLISGGQLQSVMAGMPAAFVHDRACELQMGDRKWRRELFVEAYDSTMLQYYPDHDPEAWGSAIKRGVLLGSKYCSAC